MKSILFLLFGFLTVSFSCRKDIKYLSLRGKVISIIDGDTYDLLVEGNNTIRIRMEGIDAPEKGMPFYRVSKNYLSKLCFKEFIIVEIHKTDRSGRKIAFSYLQNGKELSHEMIKAGLAWHFKKYNQDADLAYMEYEAKKSKIGLWIDENPMEPWQNRSLHRKGTSTKHLFNIQDGKE